MSKMETELPLSAGYVQVKTQQWNQQKLHTFDDQVIEEVPIAIAYNGITQAVMMATPCDLEDFAIGFSLSEAIVDNIEQIYDVQLTQHSNGYEIDLQISNAGFQALKAHRRSMTGNSGCGLCGVDSLDRALRVAPILPATPLPKASAIQAAIHSLTSWQPLRQQTGACHGAVWCNLQGEKILLREDVGRHNALDKLIGVMRRKGLPAKDGFVLISSRASYEMIHKTSYLGCANLVAVSAPTSLAIHQAKQLNINLIGFARTGKYNVYHQCL